MLKISKGFVSVAVASLLILAGCGGDTETDDSGSNASTAGSTATGGSESDHSHEGAEGHSHAGDDALVWEDTQMMGDMEIKLGHHATTLHAGSAVEPAVSVTLNGESVADAQVFNSLLDADGATMLAEEVATVYEPETPDEPAHYAQGELDIPADVESVTIRFRIVTADGEEETFDVQVSVE